MRKPCVDEGSGVQGSKKAREGWKVKATEIEGRKGRQDKRAEEKGAARRDEWKARRRAVGGGKEGATDGGGRDVGRHGGRKGESVGRWTR